MLQPEDDVVFADGTRVPYNESRSVTANGLVLRRGGATITIEWGAARPASLTATTRTYLRDQRRRVHMLRVPHDGVLTTRIQLS